MSGGGTGGHIFPAIAIAQEIQKRFPEAEFLFIGANGKMEMEVPQDQVVEISEDNMALIEKVKKNKLLINALMIC